MWTGPSGRPLFNTRMPQKTCIVCNKKLKLHQRRPVNKNIAKYLRKFYLLESTSSDFICGRCSRNAYPVSRAQPESSLQSASIESAQNQTATTSTNYKISPSVQHPVKSPSRSHSYCFICIRSCPKVIEVPANLRNAVFTEHGIMITAESSCCPYHFNDNLTEFNKEELVNMKAKEQSYLDRTLSIKQENLP